MTTEQKIALLEERRHILMEKGDYNLKICGKIAREIKKLKQQA